MNTEYDELATLLGDELHDRADDVHGSAMTFADVRGRAISIRRRRRAVAGIAAAAVLAVAAPIGISAIGDSDAPEKIDLAPPPPKVVRALLTLDDLPRGESPAIEYFTEDGVVVPGSGLQELPQSWQALIPSTVDGRWLALSPSRDEVMAVDQDFETTVLSNTMQKVISDPDRDLVAWTTPEPKALRLTVHSTTDSTLGASWEFPEASGVEPVDFAADGSLVYQSVDASTGGHQVAIVESDGTRTQLSSEWVKGISASPESGLVAVQTRSRKDASGCFGVVDPSASTTTTRWETCDHSLGAFSPDGEYVVASDPYLSGMGITSLAVLDADTGDLVASFDPERTSQIALLGVAWESTDTLVAVAFEEMSYSLVRFGVDGTLEDTVDPVQVDPVADGAFYLGEDRRRGY